MPNDTIPIEPLLDIADTAKFLKVTPRHVRTLVAHRRLPPPVRVGRRMRWSADVLRAWVAGGCQPIPAPDES